MSYKSATIQTILNKLNKSYFLPAIQRPFVWEPDKIIRLFDSLMKRYPISAFLFWELKPETKSHWEIYKFVENFKFGSIHNDTAGTDGLDVSLVLDGQQRLTSLLIGLRGSYTVRQKHKRKNNPDAWQKQRLYIDLLKDGTEGETEIDVTYGFKFFDIEPKSNEKSYWMKVGQILDFDDRNKFDDFKDSVIDKMPDSFTRAQDKILKRNIDRLYDMIWEQESIAFYIETNQSLNRVLDIFIRANDGGTKLGKSDLLFSMITSKWDGINARDEISDFLEYINESLIRKNDLDKDFIMKACFVLSDLNTAYTVKNFTKDNLEKIRLNWSNIKSAIENTVTLANSFGLDRDTLTGSNVLIPIAYYIINIGIAFDGSSEFEDKNAREIHLWLLNALIGRAFGGVSDNTISSAREAIKEGLKESKDFPRLLLDNRMKKLGNYVSFNNDSLKEILDFKYSDRKMFWVLSLLYEDHNWGNSLYHIDHIFPKAMFTLAELKRNGISEDNIAKYQEYSNSIFNLELLLGRENSEKSNKPFAEWIDSRNTSFKSRHLIPENTLLYQLNNFCEFCEAREKLITDKIMSVFGLTTR